MSKKANFDDKTIRIAQNQLIIDEAKLNIKKIDVQKMILKNLIQRTLQSIKAIKDDESKSLFVPGEGGASDEYLRQQFLSSEIDNLKEIYRQIDKLNQKSKE